MEGILWKWTNYFSGWQPRWFVLDNGIMSYYKSQEDVTNGCKGSLKMTVCDVIVHPTDPSRMDLIIPGEQHFYLKASTPQERQQWLVTLGSAKACLNYGKAVPSIEEISPEEIRAKKSELRLYCDLLMQQVQTVKSSVSNDKEPNVEKINEATCLLSATCDTFIRTLEECMTIVNAKQGTPYPTSHSGGLQGPDPSLPASPVKGHLAKRNSKGQFIRAGSVDRHISSGNDKGQRTLKTILDRPERPKRMSESDVGNDKHSVEDHRGPPPNDILPDHEKWLTTPLMPVPLKNGDVRPKDGKIQTFFSNMTTKFCDVVPLPDGGIPVLPFLDACRNVLPIFDKLGATAFAPVKLDISGNIRKIHMKYSTKPESFPTLQSIVLYEKSMKQSHLSTSATVALLWLKRSVEFISEFLKEFVISTDDDLSAGVTNAYSRTLRPYHGWVLRGMFAVALSAVPSKKDFMLHLSLHEEDAKHSDFSKQLMLDMEQCLNAQDHLIKILSEFYVDNSLDSSEQQ
ncbi:pleckstrin homology domain-containing family A member 8-like isoform X2 [Lineus longissimus]|uniref:pleckstrin homology domain-containing family A member 8-like isoform X2 n=1 Tax=Lineus longissimus TaxID=88925 RepID=UPI002B4FA34D